MKLSGVGAVLLAVGALVGSACVDSDPGAHSTLTKSVDVGPDEGRVASPTLVGVAVPGGMATGVRAVEEGIGGSVDLVRLFYRWDDVFPNADLTTLVDQGRVIHVSVRPRTRGGNDILWADLAIAQPGTTVHDQLLGWVDRLAELPPGTYVTINHEPETQDSASNGSVEDYVAMWRRFVELLRERGGGHVRTVWTMTGGSFRDGRAELWYPGDDVVDVVGADVYNWFTCQGTNRAWIDFRQLIEPPLAFARRHGKPLALPETASVEDPAVAERKAQWIDDAATMMAEPAIDRDLEFIAWFDVTAPGGTYPNCVWDHDTTPSSALAFGRLVSSLTAD